MLGTNLTIDQVKMHTYAKTACVTQILESNCMSNKLRYNTFHSTVDFENYGPSDVIGTVRKQREREQ